MTGIRVSNIIAGCAALCAGALGGPLVADQLALGGGARLTGTVRSITEAGVVELASELAPEPLLLQPGAVDRIEFSSTGAVPPPPPAVVELTNGDLLPATLETLDERQLTVVSPDAGRLVIPREALKSLQLGSQRHQALYAGPRNLDEWTHGESDAKNWVFERDRLIANGPATASLTLPLPQQFILRLTLKWQPQQIPNFQVFFADPLKAKGESCDRYYLQFGGAGVEIKREASHGKRFNTLVQFNRNPNLYPDHELRVELRVDRKAARLQLFLNGEPEGEFADPIPAVPDGSGISLVCNPPNGSSQEIRGLEILELDDARGRHHAEDRGDAQTDRLISREDDRWGGHLVDIRQTDAGQVFRFTGGARNGLLEIPAADVSAVFFATKAETPPGPAQAPPFVLHLRWDGSMRVASCQFRDDAVAATHPLLGQLLFRREGLVSMERPAPKPKTAP